MISWRYHLVSIVAVILALALGVLAGATVIGDPFVNQLRKNTADAEARANQARIEADRISAFLREAAPYLTADALVGARVVLVTAQDLDNGLVERARSALQLSGATVVDRIQVNNALAAPSPPDRQQLESLLGIGSAEPTQLANALAERLAAGPARHESGPGEDILALLAAKGFLTSADASGSALADVGGPGQIVVLIAGTTGSATVQPQDFLVPLVEALVRDGQPVAAGEGSTSRYGFVGAVRDDGNISAQAMVTVDDLDLDLGGVALVMGLQRLESSPAGTGGGDYGVHGGTLIPPYAAPSPTP